MTVLRAAVYVLHGTVWATVQPVNLYRGKFEQHQMHKLYQGKSSRAKVTKLLVQ